MLFNSYEFIFLFLPITLIVYFLLNKLRLTLAAKVWLVLASLLFYSWWNVKYLPLISVSIIFNYAVGTTLAKSVANDNDFRRKPILILSLILNVALLGYFKYMDFFISNINHLADSQIKLLHIVLPLGISFFTFTQITYLVDSYKSIAKEYSFWNYSLFVTFFPHLLAGPIIHHKEMMPQFDRTRNKVLNYNNLSIGLYLLFIGLFKKVIIADSFAVWANYGFGHTAGLTFLEGWVISLSYTFQIYFDFSGYIDMALGSSRMFNIKLPFNFNSPYKSLSIQEFWKRWNMTLSRFLKDYIYIPLGGNRVAELRNLMLTFLIGGLWHGAGWTFIIWGFLHGAALVIQRIWGRFNVSMPKLLAWFVTFNFVNIAWVFFRAKNLGDAYNVLKAMFGMNGIALPASWDGNLAVLKAYGITFGNLLGGELDIARIALAILLGLIISLFFRNSNEMAERFKPNYKTLAFIVLIGVYALISLNKISEFIYFNF